MIFGERPMLQRAAATTAEMLADRLGAFVAWLVDVQQMAAIGMAGDRLDGDDLAPQGVGNVNRAVGRIGDTVAAVAEPRDPQLLSHASPQARTRHCRRRPRAVRG